ncbi:erythrocyte vesicle protein 1 [Plasmodium sp. DRC-Itaito]|nr:erythrocyte vesicle protein 1 [Plasmodium sp. DRC-Itaito]
MYKKCFILYSIFLCSFYIYIIKNDHLNSEQRSFSRIIAESSDTKKNEFFFEESVLGATSSRGASLDSEENTNINMIKYKNKQSYDDNIAIKQNVNKGGSINNVIKYNKEEKEKKKNSFLEFPKEFNILDVVWPYMKQPREVFKKSSIVSFLMDHYFRHELYILESSNLMKPRRRTYEAPCFEYDDFELETDSFFLENYNEDHHFFNKYRSYFFSLNVLDHCKRLKSNRNKYNNINDDRMKDIKDDRMKDIKDDHMKDIKNDHMKDINNYHNDGANNHDSQKKNNPGGIQNNCNTYEEKKIELLKRNNIMSKDDLIAYNKNRIEEYYDRIISYFFGLIILYHNKKETNLNYYTKFLSLDKYKNMYMCINNDISKIYEKATLYSYEEFSIIQQKDLQPDELKGNIKYYYFFNRVVYTSLYLVHEILQQLDGLMYTFKRLPINIQKYLSKLPEIRIKEIKKNKRLQKNRNENSIFDTCNYKDLYYVSSEYYDYVSRCLIWSNYYFFNYMSKTIVYSVKKRNYEYIEREKSKINLFLEYSHNDIIEYIKDITFYFKLIVNEIETARLFSEPVMLCFQLFSEHYLYLIKNIISILLIHIEKPLTRKSNSELKKIFNCLKDQQDLTKNILNEFHSKNKIRYDPTEWLIYRFFASIEYKQDIAHKYILQCNNNIISLMLKIFNYFHILVITLIIYLNLHSMYTLFIDLDIDDTLKFQHDLEFLNYFKRYQDFNNHLFDTFRSDHT